MDPSEIERRKKARLEKKINRKQKNQSARTISGVRHDQTPGQSQAKPINGISNIILPQFYNALPRAFAGFRQIFQQPAIPDYPTLFSSFLRGFDSKPIPRLYANVTRQNMLLSSMLLEWRKRGMNFENPAIDFLKCETSEFGNSSASAEGRPDIR